MSAQKNLRSNHLHLANDPDESSHRQDKQAEVALTAIVPRLDKFVPFYEDNQDRLGDEPRSSVEDVRAYRRRMGNSSTRTYEMHMRIYMTQVMLGRKQVQMCSIHIYEHALLVHRLVSTIQQGEAAHHTMARGCW